MAVSPLRRKLGWLLAGRAAVVVLLLGSGALFTLAWPGTLQVDTFAFFTLLGITIGLTITYALVLKYAEQHRWIIDLQLAADAIVVSVIVALTGGITSYFASLYTLPIIAAPIVESRRGGVMVGVLSSVLYSGLVIAQYTGIPALGILPGQDLPSARLALYTVGLNLFGFVAIAALSGYLAEGLRQADLKLQKASDEIEDLQAFSRHIIDSLTSGLATTDMTGRILTFNRAASAITGVAVRDAVGAGAMDVFGLPTEFHALFSAAPDRPQLPRMDFEFTRADGKAIQLGLSTAVLQTPRGESGFLLTFQDVTDVRRQQREAHIQQRLAAVGEMAAGIAHEIRNPLASMAGSIQILRQELPLTPDQSELMDIVLRESDRLNETIRSFLAYAKPQRQSNAEVDVRRVLTDAATLLENSSERTPAHRIALDVPADPILLQADENQLRQIVWNLATNGLRAMPSGGQLTLALCDTGGDGSDGEVRIEVRDQGTGIAPQDLDGIFQPFRAGFTRGTGLGLSIVQRIVTDYGGEIRVSSRRGEGTTIQVSLPRAAHDTLPAPPLEKVG
jgi:two-component system sensor histidine kinase PilS (NtrC family)